MAETSGAIPFSSVHIVGTGLLGTSVGLVARDLGIPVTVEDSSPTRQALAVDYGAGVAGARSEIHPDLVVVATPPDVTASVVAQALADFPQATVIDVASVKASILDQLVSQSADLSRYVGTHPMAGRERGGPTAARIDLFTGRPWVVCQNPDNSAARIRQVTEFVQAMGGSVHLMSARDHDEAVARVSHFPQVVSSLIASTLVDSNDTTLSLAGQGLRDVTRIAGSDAELWAQILTHNSTAVASLLERLGHSILTLAHALEDLEKPGAKTALSAALEAGAEGVSRLPGKHGGSARFLSLTVIIDDTPGQLASLLTDVGELGVNLEDMRLEHSPGAAVGFVELSVAPSVASGLESSLVERGWRIAGESA